MNPSASAEDARTPSGLSLRTTPISLHCPDILKGLMTWQAYVADGNSRFAKVYPTRLDELTAKVGTHIMKIREYREFITATPPESTRWIDTGWALVLLDAEVDRPA